ncbi:MAG: DUF4340 domain-containing protein [Magnetococcales bacterium]|nr:DUF4340 domain-containing protein [Magnetococcales bacterium]
MTLFRKSLFWLIALLVLGGTFEMMERGSEESKRVEAEKLRLLSFLPEAVTGFWIQDRQGSLQARAERDGEGWRLTEPLGVAGDSEAIDKILANVVNARRDAVLFDETDPGKLEELGLNPPVIEMGLVTAHGETVLQFGDKGPTHNVAYAMFKGAPQVYRIHSDVPKEADKKISDLRDRTILDFDPMTVQRVELDRRDELLVVIENDNARWDMLKPKRAQADMTQVLATLYEIKNGEVKAFLDEPDPDPVQYGLDNPRVRITIQKPGPAKPLSLEVGKKDRSRRGYFARTGDNNSVFVVEEKLVHALLAEHTAWIDETGL